MPIQKIVIYTEYISSFFLENGTISSISFQKSPATISLTIFKRHMFLSTTIIVHPFITLHIWCTQSCYNSLFKEHREFVIGLRSGQQSNKFMRKATCTFRVVSNYIPVLFKIYLISRECVKSFIMNAGSSLQQIYKLTDKLIPPISWKFKMLFWHP